jgi:dolichyl-phosphate-mannose--protein O-mannosyl transferase
MTGAISAIFYFASFTPHYTLGWWGGIADLFHYYKDVVWYEKSVSTATHPYASPWWSWPMMLRPVAYWQNFPEKGSVVATIWGAGNPLTWWGVIPAMTITAVRALERPNIARTFLVIGFLAYYVIWIPIGRILFLYHYMPSVYLGYLALGAVLADLYYERAEFWESFVLLMTVIIAAFVGLGHMCTVYNPTWVPKTLQLIAGLPVAGGLGLIYLLLVLTNRSTSRFVFFVFVGASFLLFLYYLPIWLGTPIARDGYYARMWFQGPGLRNWI